MAKRSLICVALSLLLLALTFGCQERPSKNHVTKGKLVQAPKAKAPKHPWPYSEDPTSAKNVTDNLTAKNYVLIFDGSGSMSEVKCSGKLTKCEAAKIAVQEWLKTVSPESNVGLVFFSWQGTETHPMTSGNRDALITKVKAIRPGGGTPLAFAVEMAYRLLTAQGKRQLGYGEYTIVVVTDGKANDIPALNHKVNYILKDKPIVIYTIGFCIGNDHTLNQKDRTIYKTADNPRALRQGLKDVLAESEDFRVLEFEK